MGKIKLCGLLFIGGLLVLMSSCLGNNNTDMDNWALSNAQIASFSLASDSIAGLSNVKFTIDQINGKIYNKDSMPYGTVLDYKVISTVGFDSQYGVRGIMFIEQATGDTVQSVTDSINFSAPVMITVTAYDGMSKKTYEAQINVHQVNPDTMVWEKYAEFLPGRAFTDMKVFTYKDFYYMYVIEAGVYQLYKADYPDITNWENLTLTDFPDKAILSQMTAIEDTVFVITEEGGLYCSIDGQAWTQVELEAPIKTLLGYLPASVANSRKDVLCCIADVAGGSRFLTIDRQLGCTQGPAVPENFPLSGFGSFNYETMHYPRLVIASGRDSNNNFSNSTYATMDGITWALLTNAQTSYSYREGAAAFYYGNVFFVVGGVDDAGNALKDICFSFDQGISWLDKRYVKNENYDADLGENEDNPKYVLKSIFVFPEEYTARGFTSVIIDKDNYMMLFGGKAKNDTNVLNEIWRGRVNRLGFGKDR